MQEKREHDDRLTEMSEQVDEPQPYRVRLPGFVKDEEIGLGDVIKRATSAIGIRPCGGCEGRAAALNRRFVITGRRGR
jgi:hypothetical protein